jgi:hypothetical protein
MRREEREEKRRRGKTINPILVSALLQKAWNNWSIADNKHISA